MVKILIIPRHKDLLNLFESSAWRRLVPVASCILVLYALIQSFSATYLLRNGPQLIKGRLRSRRGQDKKYHPQSFEFLDAVAGGVLPIRRFTIIGGRMIDSVVDVKTESLCNDLCLENHECDAWEFRGLNSCMMFTQNETAPFDIYQASNNNPQFVVGFTQRRAGILSPIKPCNTDGTVTNLEKEKKTLYILHFHHEAIPSAYERIINEILPSSWMSSFMDLVVITPREVSLTVANGIIDKRKQGTTSLRASSLINPFRARQDSSKRGSNGHMSLPLARARFPGYGGYLLVNDDAMLRTWNLAPEVWFGNRPWGTFPSLQYDAAPQMQRSIKKRYPYGPYSYSWYNYDSGSVCEKTGTTRSNFDACLDALNELCLNETGITKDMNDALVTEFCINRKSNVLSPFVAMGGKADVLYVPGNKLGAMVSRAMTLFGEHDAFMELAYPIIINTLVPRDLLLDMPYCDGGGLQDFHSDELTYKKYFAPLREEGKDLVCPVIHPIKFGFNGSVAYWRKQVMTAEAHCSWCTWKRSNDTFWKLVS